MITIGEYIAAKQPEVGAILIVWLAKMRLKELEQYSLSYLARIMTERPRPGLGGLLRGEKTV
jgi:hypothetical protein